VLLKHYIHKTLVTTRVHPVLYIPQVMMWLLSMGDFLQQGMHVMGNSSHVTLLHKIQSFIQCKPIVPGHTLYWLEVSTMHIEAQFLESPTKYIQSRLQSNA